VEEGFSTRQDNTIYTNRLKLFSWDKYFLKIAAFPFRFIT